VVALVFLIPVLAMVLASFRAVGLPPPRTIELVPQGASLEAYGLVFDLVPFGRYAVNSLIVSAVAVPLAIVVASWAGYAAARLPRTHARVVVAIAVAALLVGRFWLFRAVGATDGLLPLIAPALLGITPVSALVFAWAFRRIPDEMFDAAAELGATPLGTWWRIGLPLVRPVVAMMAAISFAIVWGNVVDPLVYVTDERWFTVPLGLRALASVPQPQQPVMLAASVMATIPVIAAFALAQPWISARRA
jgi:multiple sugar transport system permease protein